MNEKPVTLTSALQKIADYTDEVNGKIVIFRAFTVLLFLFMFGLWGEARYTIHKLEQKLEHTVPVIDCHVINTCEDSQLYTDKVGSGGGLSWVGGFEPKFETRPIVNGEPLELEDYSWSPEVTDRELGHNWDWDKVVLDQNQ